MTKGTVLITGANGGLGSAFVEQFQKSPYASEYRGIYTVRDASKAADLQRVLSKAPSSSVHEVVELDLGSLEKVREVAGEINRKVADGTWEPIRTLILNAVFQEANNDTLVPRSRTQDGFESAFGINYLSNYLLTLMLLQSMDREAGRIVVVSSWTHDGFDKRNDGLPVFRKESQRELYSFNTRELAEGVSYDKDDGWSAGMRRYGTSKLLLVLFAHEVQKRLQMDAVLCQISVVCLDPGAMGGTRVTQRSTPFIRFLTGWFMWAIQEVLVYFAPNGDIRPPWKSANDLLVASFDDEYLKPGPTPVYLNGSVRAESSKESKDEAKQARVWSDSRTLARLREGDTVLTSWQ